MEEIHEHAGDGYQFDLQAGSHLNVLIDGRNPICYRRWKQRDVPQQFPKRSTVLVWWNMCKAKQRSCCDTSPLEKICAGSGDREILKVLDEKYQGQADLEKDISSSMSGSLKQIGSDGVDDMAKM